MVVGYGWNLDALNRCEMAHLPCGYGLMVMVGYGYGYGFKLSLHPVPYLATSSVAPAPCSARARPCLDVWWGEPFLVRCAMPTSLRPAHLPSGTHGRCRARGDYGMLLWLCTQHTCFHERETETSTSPRHLASATLQSAVKLVAFVVTGVQKSCG